MNKQDLLEWCAVFMFLSFPRNEDDWFDYCAVKHFELYDTDKQAALFWWTLRDFPAKSNWSEWRQYLSWKYHSMGLNIAVNKQELLENGNL